MRCVGIKQVLKCVKENNTKKVFVAKDTEPHITNELIKLCNEKNIEIIYVKSMTELGKMAGIEVGTSCFAE
jgi:large subunit ribosomal protein L7A